ncbi:MAG: hypothetical protein OHK0022_05420 [Roseiflexaceae bacterium]
MPSEPSATTRYLTALAQRVTAPYMELPHTRAVLLTGSVSENVTDHFSDLDISVYYDELPSEEQLAAIRAGHGAPDRLWLLGDRADGGVIEAYLVEGVECQIVHTTVSAWEASIATVLERLEVESPLQKAMDGTLHGIALHGEPLIAGWQARLAAYPDALAEAMVRHYLRFFPLWYIRDRFLVRDALLWRCQAMAETGQHILGVLAGLNRQYFSTFQFKRMRRFIDQMSIRPPNLAERIELLLSPDVETAITTLEELVAEVATLVEQHMPQVDTAAVRVRLGKRQQPWQIREV